MSTSQIPPSDGQPPALPPGFTVCPLHIAIAKAWQQEIYRRAYEQALAAQQSPSYYRRLFTNWN
jgi:hypothetical protein